MAVGEGDVAFAVVVPVAAPIQIRFVEHDCLTGVGDAREFHGIQALILPGRGTQRIAVAIKIVTVSNPIKFTLRGILRDLDVVCPRGGIVVGAMEQIDFVRGVFVQRAGSSC